MCVCVCGYILTVDMSAGPSRSELQRMEQFMNQTESQPSQPTPPSQPPQESQSSSFGVMRMPGRGRKRGPDPETLGLAPGGVTGETIKASMLGDLAVIDIANSPLEVGAVVCVCVCVCVCVYVCEQYALTHRTRHQM